jgi:hypothetical protein
MYIPLASFFSCFLSISVSNYLWTVSDFPKRGKITNTLRYFDVWQCFSLI